MLLGFQVNLQAGGRSLLRIRGPVYMGSSVSISGTWAPVYNSPELCCAGPEGIVQLENISIATLLVNLGGGYLHLRDVDFENARQGA